MSTVALSKRKSGKKKTPFFGLTQHSAPPKLVNRPWPGRSWAGFVVPNTLLHQLVLEHGPSLNADTRYDSNDPEPGWKGELTQLFQRIRSKHGQHTADAARRRLWDITHNNTLVTSADVADAICLALGLNIDRDTNLPVLPGCKRAAKELVEERARLQGIELTPAELNRLARTTYRLSLLILNYPHNTERLQNLAPFDCLRP